MILIADSGATKTDWCLAEDGVALQRITTQGINPFHQDADTIRHILIDELLPALNDVDIDSVAFYGSGCRAEKISVIENLITELFPQSDVEIQGDLIAAARALCGRTPGIACILGTGSNSCLYDGEKVVKNTPPLGYILGDEGSGAVLGRLFVNALYKGRLSQAVEEDFIKEMHIPLSVLINKVYCQPLANRFLASMSIFIHRHIDDVQLRGIVIENFRSFFRVNVLPYGYGNYQVGAIGSVAYYYQKELVEAGRTEGFDVVCIQRSPMEGLVKFHK
jgi:glucosamine kinase